MRLQKPRVFLLWKQNLRLHPPVRSPGLHYQVIEIGYGVSRAPEADLARVFEGVVRRFDLFLAVVITDDFVADALDLELVPLPGGDLEVRARELPSAPFYNVVQAVVVLQGVCADDVIIVGIL